MSSSTDENLSDGDNATGLNSIPTIDVVGADDDEDAPSPHSVAQDSENDRQCQHSQALHGAGAFEARETGHSGGERDAGSRGVPQILTDDATPPASVGASPTSPTHPQPQSILLDVPSTRARSGSGSGNSVSFSLQSRSPSPSPSRPDDASYLTTPPSPTLSTQSTPSSVGPFATSLALRDNRPDAHNNGLNSLQLLSPDSPTHGHMRKGSAATFTSTLAGTEGEPGSPSSPTGQLGVHHSLDGYPNSHQSHSRRTSITIAAPATPFADDDDASPTKVKKLSSDDAKDAENGTTKISLSDEDDTMMDTGPFPREFTPLTLAKLVDPKSIPSLEALGGIEGVLKGLGTDPKRGLCGLSTSSPDGTPPSSTFTASFAERQRVYGHNLLPTRRSKTLLALMWIAMKDKVLILLSIAAVISFALGMFQDFGTPRETFSCGNGETCTEPPVDWIEGVAIMVAVAIVVIVGSLNDWQKEKQFKALNEKKEDRTVKVIRDGNEKVINTKVRYFFFAPCALAPNISFQELVVGDVALLEPGEIVPADGVFLQGHNVRCDESGITGESDGIKKLSYADCIAQEAAGHLSSHTDCFVISGSKVLEGVGSYVVIAVGTKSFNGRIMMGLFLLMPSLDISLICSFHSFTYGQ